MPIPAVELLPADADADTSGIPPWLLLNKNVPDGVGYSIYITSPIHKAYRWYDKEKNCHIEPKHPAPGTWENTIGNKFQSNEPDTPSVFWFCRAYVRELKRQVCWIIDSQILMKAIKKAFTEKPDIAMTDQSVLNNIAVLYHDKSASPQARYSVRFEAKVCTAQTVLDAAAQPWYPSQYANGGNDPFTPSAQLPTSPGIPMQQTTNGTMPTPQPVAAGSDDW